MNEVEAVRHGIAADEVVDRGQVLRPLQTIHDGSECVGDIRDDADRTTHADGSARFPRPRSYEERQRSERQTEESQADVGLNDIQ